MKLNKDILKKIIKEELEGDKDSPVNSLKNIEITVTHDDLKMALGAFADLRRQVNTLQIPQKDQLLGAIDVGQKRLEKYFKKV